jgi:hypothetical protein
MCSCMPTDMPALLIESPEPSHLQAALLGAERHQQPPAERVRAQVRRLLRRRPCCPLRGKDANQRRGRLARRLCSCAACSAANRRAWKI